MSSLGCDKPCFVPPHPDLLAKIRAKIFKAQNQDEAQITNLSELFGGERRLAGMNDGTIYPRSHYAKPTSIMAMSNAALERAPLRGNLKVIVVLVDFKDVKMSPGTKQRMQDLWFSTGKIPTGSVTEYYQEVSNRKISLTGEVVGPFTLKENMAYYANGQYGRGWPEPNSQTMANEAFDAANVPTNLIDFNQYDNDGDGYVDAFVVVHAGRAAEETGNVDDIWSVKWSLPTERQADNVKVYGFLTVPEDAKCGVCAHECGHLLFGWPDLYDTDYSSAGIGNWCLMSFGSWGGGGDRPVHPSAWCKANQGWIDTIVERENHQIVLRDVKADFRTHRLWTNGDQTSQEYFLIENRQLTGFDESLPGDGLLIWHIDDNTWSNTDENHPKVKLLQADGLDQLKANFGRGDAGDVYPGLANNMTFNSVTNPNSKAYTGNDTYVSVTNIPASSPSMTFDITVNPVNQPPTGDFDNQTWYRLKNTYQPNAYSLGVINDAGPSSTGRLQMSRDSNILEQFWQLKDIGAGIYTIRSAFLGQNRGLDVLTSDKKTPQVQPLAPVTGQQWQIKPWGDGTWHLENAYSGQYYYLDTMEGGPKVEMNQANTGRPTQRWTITAIRQITEAGW